MKSMFSQPWRMQTVACSAALALSIFSAVAQTNAIPPSESATNLVPTSLQLSLETHKEPASNQILDRCRLTLARNEDSRFLSANPVTQGRADCVTKPSANAATDFVNLTNSRSGPSSTSLEIM